VKLHKHEIYVGWRVSAYPFCVHVVSLEIMRILSLQDKNWRNRRSQKLEKMELLNLQSSLQSEIQAKQAISEELSKTRSELIAAQK
jgi:hypothetical protein